MSETHRHTAKEFDQFEKELEKLPSPQNHTAFGRANGGVKGYIWRLVAFLVVLALIVFFSRTGNTSVPAQGAASIYVFMSMVAALALAFRYFVERYLRVAVWTILTAGVVLFAIARIAF